MAAPAGAPVMMVPVSQEIQPRLDLANLSPNLVPKVLGKEDVHYMEVMTDSARCLGWSCSELLYDAVCKCSINWVPCCWQMARPRAYYKVTENSVEFNYPHMGGPMDCCIHDNIKKTYFDKMSGVPYNVNCCSPYHFCFCIKCCGDVVAVAPHDACTNCCCAACFPCCFTWYPGLADGQSFVDYITVVRADYLSRKGISAAHGIGGILGGGAGVM